MSDVALNRRERVRQIINDQYEGVDARFAGAIGKSPASVARWFMDNPEHRRNIGERLAREIEESLKLPKYWLDKDVDVTPAESAAAQLPPLVAEQILAYAGQLSPAQQRELLVVLREAVQGNDAVREALKLPVLRHPEDKHVARALKSHSILREGLEKHHARHNPKQRSLPLLVRKKDD